MSDKYLIEKSTLTALGDIVRDYNETNDTYSLADITSQLKENSDNFKAMFNGRIETLKSNTATSIGKGRFNDISSDNSPIAVDLPNVKSIGDESMKYNKYDILNMPSLETIGADSFSYIRTQKTPNFANLREIGKNSFYFSNIDVMYLPSLEIIKSGAFDASSTTNIVLKKLPQLESYPSGWGDMFFLLPLGYFENNDVDTNWVDVVDGGYAMEALSFEDDYSLAWEQIIRDGILTEEEIRRDFYGEV
jgi:hypothetical protein